MRGLEKLRYFLGKREFEWKKKKNFAFFSFIHTITLQNTDKRTPIRWLKCRVAEQPTGFGGPPLVELLPDEEFDKNAEPQTVVKIVDSGNRKHPNALRFGRINPTQKRQIRLRIFGVDPASTQSAQETQVFNLQNLVLSYILIRYSFENINVPILV
jgi:hypothetical protein